MSRTLLLATLVILFGCALFVNGVEWLGQRLRLSGHVVGSVLAALGTAAPETLLTAVALARGSHAIGLGTVLGGPLVLSTLAFATVGLVSWLRRPPRPRHSSAHRELVLPLQWFVLCFGLALGLGLLPALPAKKALVLVPVGLYTAFLFGQVRTQGQPIDPQERLYAWPASTPPLSVILLQSVVGFGGMLWGSHTFVVGLESLGRGTAQRGELLALFLSPLATEMSEIVSSLLWTLHRREDLALANIAGSMVMQATWPVALGLLFTPWQLTPALTLASLVTLLSAVWVWQRANHRCLTPVALTLPGLAYLLYMVWL